MGSELSVAVSRRQSPGKRLREWLRAAWIAAAEEEWRRRTGRPMTSVELERILKRYPGDI